VKGQGIYEVVNSAWWGKEWGGGGGREGGCLVGSAKSTAPGGGSRPGGRRDGECFFRGGEGRGVCSKLCRTASGSVRGRGVGVGGEVVLGRLGRAVAAGHEGPGIHQVVSSAWWGEGGVLGWECQEQGQEGEERGALHTK